jgi:hypothetical protein
MLEARRRHGKPRIGTSGLAEICNKLCSDCSITFIDLTELTSTCLLSEADAAHFQLDFCAWLAQIYTRFLPRDAK